MVWLALGVARAESWCAAPLVAHEWGVTRIGDPSRGVPLPAWFARSDVVATPAARRVRDLPRDTGVRDLPVVQLYTSDAWSFPVPFAMEVGFAAGAPSAWFPPVDRLGVADLAWDALALDRAPVERPADLPWVEALRRVPGALRVTRAGAPAEPFLFYEGRTAEVSALVVRRGDSWSPSRPHYVLENVSRYAVHDVLVIADGKAWTAPSIPAGRTAGFLLADPLDAAAVRASWLARWSAGEPPAGHGWGPDCVMMRDPAVAVDRAVDHVLYAPEVEVMLDVWADRLLAPGGVRLVYREDVAAVDAAMPARLYTDMYHHVDWHRLGVVLVEDVTLP